MSSCSSLSFSLSPEPSRGAGRCSGGASGLIAGSAGFSDDTAAAGFLAAGVLEGSACCAEEVAANGITTTTAELRITLANIRENRFIVSIPQRVYSTRFPGQGEWQELYTAAAAERVRRRMLSFRACDFAPSFPPFSCCCHSLCHSSTRASFASRSLPARTCLAPP